MKKLRFILAIMLVVGMFIPTTFSYADSIKENNKIKVKLTLDKSIVDKPIEELKGKDVTIEKDENDNYIATIEDGNGNKVKQVITKEVANDLGYVETVNKKTTKDKEVTIEKDENDNYIATIEDKKGNKVKQVITKEEAKDLGYFKTINEIIKGEKTSIHKHNNRYYIVFKNRKNITLKKEVTKKEALKLGYEIDLKNPPKNKKITNTKLVDGGYVIIFDDKTKETKIEQIITNDKNKQMKQANPKNDVENPRKILTLLGGEIKEVKSDDVVKFKSNNNHEIMIKMPYDIPEGTKISINQIENIDGFHFNKGLNLAGDIFDIDLIFDNDTEFEGNFLIELTYDRDKHDSKDVDIYWYNEILNEWIRQYGDVDEETGTIKVEVDHFSKYAVLNNNNKAKKDISKNTDGYEDIKSDRNLLYLIISMVGISLLFIGAFSFIKRKPKKL